MDSIVPPFIAMCLISSLIFDRTCCFLKISKQVIIIDIATKAALPLRLVSEPPIISG